MSAAQQAGILCGEPAFHQYLSEALPNYWEKARVTGEDPYLQHRAAQTIRDICGVKSRRDIDAQAETTWSELVADYRAWMRQPEVVG
ncbi:MAG: hypothetical protein J0H17_15850 [Rhizobiales bacterium]|nr:hypothetical protein [Hyphomicrobiales bacterium]